MLTGFLVPADHESLILKLLKKNNLHNNKLKNLVLGFDKVIIVTLVLQTKFPLFSVSPPFLVLTVEDFHHFPLSFHCRFHTRPSLVSLSPTQLGYLHPLVQVQPPTSGYLPTAGHLLESPQ